MNFIMTWGIKMHSKWLLIADLLVVKMVIQSNLNIMYYNNKCGSIYLKLLS